MNDALITDKKKHPYLYNKISEHKESFNSQNGHVYARTVQKAKEKKKCV